MRPFIGICMAALLSTPCWAGEVSDYLTKDGKLKETLTVRHGAFGLVTSAAPKSEQGELWVIEPTGEWTRKLTPAKGKLRANQLAALAQHLATQDFNSLPRRQGYVPREIHDGFYVVIEFGKKSAQFDLKKPGDSRSEYLPKPGDPNASAWSRFVALEIVLTEMLRMSEFKEKPADRPKGDRLAKPVPVEVDGKPLVREHGGLFPFVGDFYGDGRLALLLGHGWGGICEEGRLVVYRNVGAKTSPRLGAPQWFDDMVPSGRLPTGSA